MVIQYIQRLKIGILLGLIFSYTLLYAQDWDPDETFKRARHHAFSGNYARAQQVLDELLDAYPEYLDARILMARVKAWQGHYNESLDILRPLYPQHAKGPDLFLALAQVEFWAGNLSASEEVFKEGLARYPIHKDMLWTYGQLLFSDKRFLASKDILEQLLELEPDHVPALNLWKNADLASRKNAIALSYYSAYFDSVFEPWHIFTGEYRRMIQSTPLTLRVHQARQFSRNGGQIELESYPRINERLYLYTQVGYSPAFGEGPRLFPEFRWGIEPFWTVFEKNELSLGLRGLYFQDNPIHLFTAQVGRYLGNSWLSFRGFYTFIEGQSDFTGVAQYRYFFGNPNHFAGIFLSSGSTPERIVSIQEVRRLDAQRYALEYQIPVQSSFFARAMVEYQVENYLVDARRRRFGFQVFFEKRF